MTKQEEEGFLLRHACGCWQASGRTISQRDSRLRMSGMTKREEDSRQGHARMTKQEEEGFLLRHACRYLAGIRSYDLSERFPITNVGNDEKRRRFPPRACGNDETRGRGLSPPSCLQVSGRHLSSSLYSMALMIYLEKGEGNFLMNPRRDSGQRLVGMTSKKDHRHLVLGEDRNTNS